MKNILRILLNLHSLRMFARTLTLAQLEDIHHKLSIVVDEARQIELCAEHGVNLRGESPLRALSSRKR
jgi:DNA-binding protein H-NS